MPWYVAISKSDQRANCTLDTCPSAANTTVVDPMTPASDSIVTNEQADSVVRTVVPAVVVSVSVVVVAGVVVLIMLLKRRDKKKRRAVQTTVNLSRMYSRRRSANNTSKYGIERNMINSNPDKNWEPPADSE